MSEFNSSGELQLYNDDEIDGDEKPYKYSFTYERATLYEYKFERQQTPDFIDPCYRCNKTVQPDDQINIGFIYHKQCFRCRVCGLPLTLQNFVRSDANGSTDKEIYCRTHVGQQFGEIEPGEGEAIDNALPTSPSNKKYIIQIEGKVKQPGQPPPSGYYNPAVGSGQLQPGYTKNHANHSPGHVMNQGRNSPGQRPSPAHMMHQGRNSPSQRPSPGHMINQGPSPGQTVIYGQYSPGQSMTRVTPTNMTNGSSYGYTPPSYVYHTPQSIAGRPPPRPRPVLKSYRDFENSGVFASQNVLEQRHKEEEERLQRFLSEEREKELRKVDDSIGVEKERAAADLLSSLSNMTIQRNTRDLVNERERIEDHFKRQRDERMKVVMDNIAAEEKTRLGKMVDRQGQEMLLLIAEKDRETDNSALYDHSMRPPVIPPETKKSNLYKSPIIFEKLDQRAVELANRDYNCYTEIVQDLTKECQTELEKARVLFRWVIAKDLNRHNVNEIIKPNASATLLKGVRSGKETYHQVFKKLCSFAGLHCEIIMGYSKGAGYKPGMRLDGSAFRNSWTAVAIDGSWRFVNCTWAARHVTGHKDDLPQIFHKYDEFYFLTDPEDYIYQHYPDDPAWQLLEIPLPFSEFMNLPVVKAPFFNYGLRFYSNYGATLNTDTGLVEIRLIAPKVLGFGSLLEPFEKNAEQKSIEGRTLLRLVKNEAIFTVSLPRPGRFYFSIYTGDYWQSDCLESASSFVINCTRMPGPAAPPYPPVPYYGPTPVLEKLNITTTNYVDPLIVMSGSQLEIKFGLPKNIKLTHTYQYFDVADGSVTDIDRYVFLRSRDEDSASYMVGASSEGYYIFSLYGADETSDSQTLDCVYRYLIVCQQATSGINVFPKTYHRWQRCTLHEPLSGDLLLDKKYLFRIDIAQAVEVFVVIGEIWHHLRRRLGFTWEGTINTGSNPGLAKIYARFAVSRDSSLFAHLMDYEIVADGETEI